MSDVTWTRTEDIVVWQSTQNPATVWRVETGTGTSVVWPVVGTPAEFPPEAHTHGVADLTDLPAEFPPEAHSHAWDDIGSKPTSFPPSAHTHTSADITDMTLMFGWSGAAADVNQLESHRVPVPAGTVTAIFVSITDAGAAGADTDITLFVDGVDSAVTVTVESGDEIATATPALVVEDPALLSVSLDGSKGNHVNGLVRVSYEVAS